MPKPVSYPELRRKVGRIAPTVTEYNAMRDALRGSGHILHGASTPAVTTANASDSGTAVTLANALKTAWGAHIASTAAHLAADTTNTISAANATNEATAITLVNELKGDFNSHHVSATYHTVGGAGGAAAPANIATADATDEATLVALVNATKSAVNLHFASGFTAASDSD
jgi:hypothetical protein